MLVGYMRVSTDADRQPTDLQEGLKAEIDERHIFVTMPVEQEMIGKD